MADYFKGLTDRYGRPIEKKLLTQEIDAPTLTGVRSPLTGYPGDGLDPQRLAAILREADTGNPLRYLELAETIEERDLHYAGVLGTRKRSVSQLEITVEAASDDALDQEKAELVRGWLKRDELSDELFDMLDAVGKGYSFTQIVWDSSTGDWWPKSLIWSDPRWFRFDRIDGRTPTRIDQATGQDEALPGFKYVYAVMRAKSGLPVRSGLARIVAWAWMFKAFTQRDWTIFTQNFGQPTRIGKYGAGATAADRATLFRAVANIAGDCAAIIPESMQIEFVESKTGATSLSLYKDRADWLDQQVSKAVLGQTGTTDALTGGLGSGKEHRQVQEDIERADARQLSAIINRDLIRPWMMLQFGSDENAPRVKIGRAETKDVKLIVESVRSLVPFGLKAGQNQMRDLLGIGQPEEGDELLEAPAMPPPVGPHPEPVEGEGKAAAAIALNSAPPAGPGDLIARSAADVARPAIGDLLDAIGDMVREAKSFDEIRARLKTEIPDLNLADLESAMRQAMLVAELTGRAEIMAPSAGSG